MAKLAISATAIMDDVVSPIITTENKFMWHNGIRWEGKAESLTGVTYNGITLDKDEFINTVVNKIYNPDIIVDITFESNTFKLSTYIYMTDRHTTDFDSLMEALRINRTRIKDAFKALGIKHNNIMVTTDEWDDGLDY